MNFTTNHTANYTIHTTDYSILIMVLSCTFLIGISFYSIKKYLYYKFIQINETIIPINEAIPIVDVVDTELVETDVEIKIF